MDQYHGYGSIPIRPSFGGWTSRKIPAFFGCEHYRFFFSGFDPLPYFLIFQPLGWDESDEFSTGFYPLKFVKLLRNTESAKEFAQAALDALKAGIGVGELDPSVDKMTKIQMVEPMTVDHIISIGKIIYISCYSDGQLLRTSFGKKIWKSSQRGCSKYGFQKK